MSTWRRRENRYFEFYNGLRPCIFRHIKAHIKEDYIDTSTLDDNNLLMQYFKKHDSDNNMKLDGLELLKAISNMEGTDFLNSLFNWFLSFFHYRG